MEALHVNELTDLENLDPISGFPVYKALLAQVTRVAAGDDTTFRAASTASDRSAESSGVSCCEMPSQGEPVAAADRIYLDNNATTILHPEIRQAMLPYLESEHGNPSSLHAGGKTAHDAIETARRQMAQLIGTRPRRIIFTGGGSEADNLAIKGVTFRHRQGRIVTSRVEHPAVLGCCRFFEGRGYGVTYLDVDSEGWLDPLVLAAELRQSEERGEQILLVSLMTANNEVGTVFPVREYAAITHQHHALFHTDAVQAAGKLPLDVDETEVDLLTLSGHEFHGPKGIGALYVRKGIELEPLIHGGKQEAGLRAGTENVAAIVGMGRAAELARIDFLPKMEDVTKLRDLLEQGIRRLVEDACVNGPLDDGRRLPNTVNMTLPSLRGESLVIAMDQKGVTLSSGSACKSGSPEPSPALLAMGLSNEQAHCAVRFSLCEATTEDQVDRTLKILKQVLVELESTVRFFPASDRVERGRLSLHDRCRQQALALNSGRQTHLLAGPSHDPR